MSTNELWFQSGGGDFYDHPVTTSLIFNRDSTQYLSRTPSSAGNRQKFTFSCWAKRTQLGQVHGFFSAYTNTSNMFQLAFGDQDQLVWYDIKSGVDYGKRYNRLTRDTNGWYHIVFTVDTTLATTADRVKMYCNNQLLADTGVAANWGDVPQNYEFMVNSAISHNVGRRESGNYRMEGYLAETHFIDGQALDPTSFGEYKAGVWKPIAYSGSYGTNGFYLKYDGNANDSSGNGNNFTENGGIGSWQYVNDGPTQNFCKFSQIDRFDASGSFDFAFGDLQTKGWGNGGPDFRASMGMKTGKWYWEFRSNYNYVDGMNTTVGITTSGWRSIATTGRSYGVYGYLGTKDSPMSWPGSAHFGASFANGDIYMVAFDADNGKIWFGKNGSWYNSGSVDASANPATGTNPAYSGIDTDLYTFQPFIAFYDAYSSRPDLYWNFGQNPTFNGATTAGTNSDDSSIGLFKYSVPSGFNCLCASNLPVADGVNPAEGNSPQDHFNAVAYTGNGNTTTGQSITGVGFQPDFVWIKNRTRNQAHVLHDVVRGTDAEGYIPLTSGTNTSEATFNSTWHNNYGEMSAIGSDGFTVVSGSTVSAYNGNNDNYASWNWKAGGSGVSNTAGTITSTVSANQDAGFSIVKYTGNNSSGSATVGHGLSQAPELIIAKLRDNNSSTWTSWPVGTKFIGWGDSSLLYLDTTNSTFDGYQTTPWNNTAPTSSVFSVASSAGAGMNYLNANYIAYCFHRVAGYCDMGIYEGNSSTDGTFVYTGFKPKFVMWKAINSAQNWFIHDTARAPYNVSQASLLPNRNDLAELTNVNWRVDFLSNGFKYRYSDVQSNNSSYDYFWIAFAENPLAYANAH